MTALTLLRQQIRKLYTDNPNIHISGVIITPKTIFSNTPVKLVGVYPSLFEIEENLNGTTKRHTLPYTDVLIKHIVIEELNEL